MLFFWLFIVFQAGMLMLSFMAMKRLYKYIRVYRFDESMYTLLFGFVHLHYFVWLYIGVALFTALVGVLFAYSLLLHAVSA